MRVGVKNKVPSARSETLLWLAECIQGSAAEALLKVHKEVVPILMEVGTQTDRQGEGSRPWIAMVEDACTRFVQGPVQC